MELASVLKSIADQGIMFWSATGAVALGVTLIIAAGIIQVRRLRRRSGRRVSPIPEARIEAVHKSPNQAILPEKSREYGKISEAPAPWPEELDSQEMDLLLARLRSAADQLEKYQCATCQNPVSRAESPLKDTSGGVDYLFRAGTG